jgi:hypothetical protein
VHIDAKKHITAGRGSVLTTDTGVWWVRAPGELRDRVPGPYDLNEYLFDRLAERAGCIARVRLGTPRAAILKDRTVGIEFFDDIVFSLKDRPERKVGGLLRVWITVLDVCLMNSDRVAGQTYWSESRGWVFLDHDRALLADGSSDLIRFTRPAQTHPHGDYIHSLQLQPRLLEVRTSKKIGLQAIRSIKIAWNELRSELTDTTLKCGLASEEHWQHLDRLPGWWDEIESRVDRGTFFDPSTFGAIRANA